MTWLLIMNMSLTMAIFLFEHIYVCVCSIKLNSINFIVVVNWSSWYPQSCYSSFVVGHSVLLSSILSCTLCWSFCSFTLGSSMCIAPAFDSCTSIILFARIALVFLFYYIEIPPFMCTAPCISIVLSHILHWFFCSITLRFLPSVIFYLLCASFPCWVHNEVLIMFFIWDSKNVIFHWMNFLQCFDLLVSLAVGGLRFLFLKFTSLL